MNVEFFKEMMNMKVEKTGKPEINSNPSAFKKRKGSFYEIMKDMSKELGKTNKEKEGVSLSEEMNKVFKALNRIVFASAKNSAKSIENEVKRGEEIFGDLKLSERAKLIRCDLNPETNSKDAGIDVPVDDADRINHKDSNNVKKLALYDVKASHEDGKSAGQSLERGTAGIEHKIRESESEFIYEVKEKKEDKFKNEFLPESSANKVLEMKDEAARNAHKDPIKINGEELSRNREREKPRNLESKKEGKSNSALELGKIGKKDEGRDASGVHMEERAVVSSFSKVKEESSEISSDQKSDILNPKKVMMMNIDKKMKNQSIEKKLVRELEFANIDNNEDGLYPVFVLKNEEINAFDRKIERYANELENIVNKIVKLSKKVKIYINYPEKDEERFKNRNFTNLKVKREVQVSNGKKIVLEKIEINFERKARKNSCQEERIIHELKGKIDNNARKIKTIHASIKFQQVYSEKSQIKEGRLKGESSYIKKSKDLDIPKPDDVKTTIKAFDRTSDTSILKVEKEGLTVREVVERVTETIVKRMDESNFKETASLRLNPPDLGKIEVIIVKNGDNVEIRFKVFNRDAHDALERSLHLLANRLSSQGFNVERVEVMQEGKESFDDDRGREGNDGSYGGSSKGDANSKQKERREEGDSDDGE